MSNTAFEVRTGLSVNSNILEVNAISGQVGINTAANNVSLTINATDGIYLPVGNTAQRPALSPNGGIIRFNTDTSSLEWATPIAWKNLTVPLNAGRLLVNDGWMANNTTSKAAIGNNNINFIPYNGNGIRINGAVYELPAGGISANATSCYVDGVLSSLSTNGPGNYTKVYYVYVFNNNGTLTLDFSTTGHTTSTTPGNIGTEIKIGDDSRSLVGMTAPAYNPSLIPNVYFAQNNSDPTVGGISYMRTVCLTISWFNRRWQWVNWNQNFSTNQPGGNWYPYLNLTFLMWGDDLHHTAYLNGFPYMGGVGADGVSPAGQIQYYIQENGYNAFVGQQSVISTATQGSFPGVGYVPFAQTYSGTGNAVEGYNYMGFSIVLYNYQFQNWINFGVRYRG